MIALLLFILLIILPMALRRHADTWRGAILAGAIVFAGILVAITEALSAIHALSFAPVLVFWLVITIRVMGFALANKPARIPRPSLPAPDVALLGGIAVILAVTCVIALFAAPNNYDAMTYHLPRVMHWIQNASVAHYPTANARQLFNSPLAEFFIAHFQILAGNDRFSAFPQWLAFAGSVIGVSEIARQLGANRRGQLVAAALCAALPMAILQSTSAQNDLVAAFFLVAVISLGLKAAHTHQTSEFLMLGAAIGLSLLAKVTNFIFVFPFAVWFFVGALRKMGFAKWLVASGLAALLALGINAPHFARNFAQFRSPIAPASQNEETLNQLYTPAAFVSNLARNLSLHTTTPLDSLNRAEESAIRQLHTALGLSENDPRTTLRQLLSETFSVNKRAISNNENYVSSPAQLALLVCAMLAHALTPGARKNKTLWAFLACAVFGFAALSFYIKWMPYNARFHLSFFVIVSAYIAVVFGSLSPTPSPARKQGGLHWMGFAAAALVMLLSAPWLARNTSHPLVGTGNVFATPREKQLFLNAATFETSYTGAAQAMAALPCRDFGLRLGGDDWEYPLWVLPAQYGKTDYTLRLANGSQCAVISSARWDYPPGADFAEVWRGDQLAVYARR